MSDKLNESLSPTTVIKRWELWLSLLMFAATSAMQAQIVPSGSKYEKLLVWFVNILAQVGIIFGRPLLVRGPTQNITNGEK